MQHHSSTNAAPGAAGAPAELPYMNPVQRYDLNYLNDAGFQMEPSYSDHQPTPKILN
jgi:hypothetical protein